MTNKALAAALAERTADAYAFDRFRNWKGCALYLLRRGFTEKQAEAILRSKWMRWASDASEKRYGQASSVDLARFLDKQKNLARDVAELTAETFPEEAQHIAQMEARLATVSKIAKDYLNVETLEKRNRDALDFHDCAVWSIRDALVAAFEAGRTSKGSN